MLCLHTFVAGPGVGVGHAHAGYAIETVAAIAAGGRRRHAGLVTPLFPGRTDADVSMTGLAVGHAGPVGAIALMVGTAGFAAHQAPTGATPFRGATVAGTGSIGFGAVTIAVAAGGTVSTAGLARLRA